MITLIDAHFWRSSNELDALVVVKWFVVEDYSREARLFRDAYAMRVLDLAAPSILPYEV